MKDWKAHAYLEAWLARQALDRDSSWILALSGGADSMALAVAFRELLKAQSPLLPDRLIVAHLDHGWREQSQQEAQELAQWVGGLAKAHPQLQFVMRRLEKKPQAAENLEAFARAQRHRFFEELANQEGARYLFLAHHAGDRRETLFKNMLEGKELAFLHGMKERSTLGALTLLRPWLQVEKKQLVAFLESSKASWFEDCTNRELRFLRARLREKIFPALDAHWPKAWRKGLDQLACYSEELSRELEGLFPQEAILAQAAIGGWVWKLPSLGSAYQWRYFLRLASSSIDPLEKSGSQRLVEAIMGQKPTSYRSARYLWRLQFPYLFARLEEPLEVGDEAWQRPFETVSGPERWGPWLIEPAAYPFQKAEPLAWHEYCLGEFFTPVFERWTRVELLPQGALRSRVLRHMQRAHVPDYLRAWMPLVESLPDRLVWNRWELGDRGSVCLKWSWKPIRK